MNKSTSPIRSSLAADPDFSDLVLEFVSELPIKVTAIQKSVAENDATSLKRTFHQLRGACGGYGFPMLSEAAGMIEDRVNSNESIAQLESRISDFIEMLGRTTAEPAPDMDNEI